MSIIAKLKKVEKEEADDDTGSDDELLHTPLLVTRTASGRAISSPAGKKSLTTSKFVTQVSTILTDDLLAALLAKVEAERNVEGALIKICDGVPLLRQQELNVEADQLCATKKIVLSCWSQGVDPSEQVVDYFKTTFSASRKDAVSQLHPVIDDTVALLTPYITRAAKAQKKKKKRKEAVKVELEDMEDLLNQQKEINLKIEKLSQPAAGSKRKRSLSPVLPSKQTRDGFLDASTDECEVEKELGFDLSESSQASSAITLTNDETASTTQVRSHGPLDSAVSSASLFPPVFDNVPVTPLTPTPVLDANPMKGLFGVPQSAEHQQLMLQQMNMMWQMMQSQGQGSMPFAPSATPGMNPLLPHPSTLLSTENAMGQVTSKR